jgi:hypothetical protein
MRTIRSKNMKSTLYIHTYIYIHMYILVFGMHTKVTAKNLSYEKELWLGELLNYYAASDVNIDKTCNHRCRLTSPLVPMVHHPDSKELVFKMSTPFYGGRASVVCIATGYGMDDWRIGVRMPVGSRIISSPCRPPRLWCPHSLLSNGYRGLFPRSKAAGAWSWPIAYN